MFVVISSPTSLVLEVEKINTLFASGMSLFHLRKPNYSDVEMRHLLLQIDSSYYSKIALHSCHELAAEFRIKRLHFTEEKRRKIREDVLINYKEKKFTLSTSIHDLCDLENLSNCFDYVFCSPVFDSISKSNCKAKEFNVSLLNGIRTRKLIALGGIDETTIQKALYLGFDGVAVLGAIWMSENPTKTFKHLNSTCHTIVQ